MTDQRPMLGAMLRIPFQVIVDNIYSAVMEAGYSDLRPAHFIVFQHIRPGGVRASSLAEKAQITKQSMGSLINYLQEHNYIEKFADPSDGRAQLIRLTEKGQDVERIARETISRTQSEWGKVVGEKRLNDLFTTLQLLVTHIENERHE